MNTANQIYSNYVKSENISFKNFLKWEEHKYFQRKPKSEFLIWLNRKYNLQGKNAWMNSTGERNKFFDNNDNSTASNSNNRMIYYVIGGTAILGILIYAVTRK